MKYYDLKRNWGRVRPHLTHPRVEGVLVRDFGKFAWARCRRRFEPGMKPAEFETCDWAFDHRGRWPQFWDYCRFEACHWLVNFALRLAEQVRPRSPWRVLSSEDHSTVWDGAETLFEFNFQAFGIPPDECFRMASRGIQLPPGKELKVYVPHFDFLARPANK